jgi:SAM-dependent methyltransferase
VADREVMSAMDGQAARSRPQDPPPTHFDVRAEVAARTLSGSGVEIGALHFPVPLPPQAHARYVDRMTTAELRREYPQHGDKQLVDVDIVDDGERLVTIADGTLDFIIANHFLEHCHDPIGTIETHLTKLVPGGALFYAVPDKRFTFDVDRPVTSLEHMVRDHEEGPQLSRAEHYEEWARLVYPDPKEPTRDARAAAELATRLDAADYSIHLHVWTQAEFLELILHCRDRFADAFDIEVVWQRSLELILVLRKAG